MKNMFILFVLLSSISNLYAQEKPGRVKEDILPAILKLEIPMKNPGESLTGTGFLISRPVENSEIRQFFLITNKHMIGDWNLADGNIINYFPYIIAFLYTDGTFKDTLFKRVTIPLLDKTGLPTKNLLIHPNSTTDIVAIDVTKEMYSNKNILAVSFDLTYLVPFSEIYKNYFTGIGDQVFAIGYPAGITSKKSNLPIAKSCYISSLPGEEFQVDVTCENRAKQVKSVNVSGKLIIIDGLIVGGNSGGPVVLPSEIKFKFDDKTSKLQSTNKIMNNLVLGIVSSGFQNTGINIIYSSDYISELIDQMPKKEFIKNKL